METFEEKLEVLSTRYNQVLNEYDQNATPHIIGIIARTDEFIKASANIKVAC